MKGAIGVLTRYLAKELGSRGIAAYTVAPGAIETDFSGGMIRDNPQLNQFVAITLRLAVRGCRMTSARRSPPCWLKTTAGSTPSALKRQAVCLSSRPVKYLM